MDDQKYVWRAQCLNCKAFFKLQELHRGCPKCGRIGSAHLMSMPVEEDPFRGDDGKTSTDG